MVSESLFEGDLVLAERKRPSKCLDQATESALADLKDLLFCTCRQLLYAI
jgi:hypothetical protein